MAGPSSLEPPSPPRPVPGRWLVPEPPPCCDRLMRNIVLRGSQFRAPSPPAGAPQAGRWFKTSFQKIRAGQRRALRPPPAPSPACFRRSRRGGQFIRLTCPRAPSFAGRWSVWSRGRVLHLRNACPPACFEKRAESSFGTRPFQRPGQPCGGLQRPLRPVGPAASNHRPKYTVLQRENSLVMPYSLNKEEQVQGMYRKQDQMKPTPNLRTR